MGRLRWDVTTEGLLLFHGPEKPVNCLELRIITMPVGDHARELGF